MDANKSLYPLYLRRFLDVILFFIFLTSSFDTILNLKLAGFSIRVCNLLMLVFSATVIVFTLIKRFHFNILFFGFWSFIIWFVILIINLQNSILLMRGIGYLFWLLIFFAFIIALAAYISDIVHFRRIISLYINSFTIIAAFALIQLTLTLFGVDVLVEYYFKSGIPRVHGFSYEPSYFSTYLFVPWAFHFLLYFTADEEFKERVLNKFALPLLTAVILISFSRMGILLMLIILLFKFINLIRSAYSSQQIKRRDAQYVGVVLLGIFLAFSGIIVYFKQFMSIFEGLPIFSRYAHSASIRVDDFMNTWDVFLKSPLIGYSLGGVAPAIAKHVGYLNISQELVKQTEGMCIFLEVLAASGIIGFVFFILFLNKFLRSATMLRNMPVLSSFSREFQRWVSIHRLLVIALVFQLLLLCLNQNILRNYLWVHMAVINLSFFILKASFTGNDSISEA